MPIFQSKPTQIQALQIKPRADLNSVSVFEHASEIEAFGKDFVKVFAADDLSLTVECITLNGKVMANPTDWLMLKDDEVYPCPDKVFKGRYEPVP